MVNTGKYKSSSGSHVYHSCFLLYSAVQVSNLMHEFAVCNSFLAKRLKKKIRIRMKGDLKVLWAEKMLNIWASKIRKWLYLEFRTLLNLTYVRNTSQPKFLSAVQSSRKKSLKNILQYCRRLGAVCRHFVLKVYLPTSIHRKPGTRVSTICEALHNRDLVSHLGRCLFLITCVIFTREQTAGKPANHQNICYQERKEKTLPSFDCSASHSPNVIWRGGSQWGCYRKR